MIQYTLKCKDDHQCDSWFQSAEAFDKLLGAGMVTCAICGSSDVEKAIMAPRVRPARSASATPKTEQTPQTADQTPLSNSGDPAQQAIANLKKQVEENSDYVGGQFASEARAMHVGDAPERAIYGEANLEEAKSLVEDGIPITPLPFRPGRKSN